MKMPKERSAGIVVLRWSHKGWEYLTLETTMRLSDGRTKLDLPKGHLEGDESWIDAAIRETEEESGIPERDLSFTWGEVSRDFFRTGKVCRLYIASTQSEASIKRNPVSKRYEHVRPLWLRLAGDPDEERIHPYIQPSIEWVRSIVLSRRIDSQHGRLSRQESDIKGSEKAG